MIYCKTIEVERIVVHPLNNMANTQFVELIKHGDEPLFSVWVDDGHTEWVWEFDMNCPSDYERVKLNIFDAIFECNTMIELANALNAIFINAFEDILIDDGCEECDGCEGCKYMQ